jgi:hypothetical protein
MKKLVGKNIHFQKMSSGHQGYQMFSLVVGEAQIHVFFSGGRSTNPCFL